MKRVYLVLAGVCLLVGLATQPAAAADNPLVGPPPSWVGAAPAPPSEKAEDEGLPTFSLVNDAQLAFDADGWTEYRAVQVKVQTAAGLQALGTLPFQWSPWSETLTFHHATILRDGQTIDVLPKNGAFTVLRRETGLDQAMLTGELTALLQPEGLQVGDILDIAISIRHADPLLKGRTGVVLFGWDIAPLGRFRLQAHWPSSLSIRWQESRGLPPLQRADSDGVTTLSLALDDVRPLLLPAHAPQRFQHGRLIEFTALTSWKQVVDVMAPLYAKAMTLGPNSPVAAQAKLIAAASSDPKVRVAAALQIVEGQIRYLAHAEAEDGYEPQNADDTWRLRYGDCKAKTTLLLALLHELGISADPALVSTTEGDGLVDRLPSPNLFDHVIVHVRLGGREYWLDGTRQGDRGLDDIVTPAYGWVLPMGDGRGGLVHLVPAPAPQPQVVQQITYDGSGNVTEPNPTRLVTIFRGDLGLQLHVQLSAVPASQMEPALRAFWAQQHTAFTPTHVAASWDSKTGEETLSAEGTSKLDWSGSGLELQNVELGGPPDIKRDAATSDPDAPYALDYPSYAETDEEVILPAGVTLSAEQLKAADVDQVIGGTAYNRFASFSGHVMRVVATQRSLQPEISAAAANASVGPLTRLGKIGVFAPAGSQQRAANDAAALEASPTSAEGHVSRGSALLDARKYQEALAEFDAAIALDAKSQDAWADRAIAHAWLNNPEASADADKADALGSPSVVAARARGLLAQWGRHFDEARAAYRRALELSPSDEFALYHLIDVEMAVPDGVAAGKALDQLLQAHPERTATSHVLRATIDGLAHNPKAAEAELLLAPTDTPTALIDRARAYLALDDKDLARADIDAAIRIRPSASAWVLRASTDGGLGGAAASADVDEALKLAPHDVSAQVWKMNAAYHRYDFAGALLFANQVLDAHPEMTGSVIAFRAELEAELGQPEQADADFARARSMTGPRAPRSAALCLDEVHARRQPAAALADCDKALAERPSDVYLQVGEMILLHRLGRDADAEKTLIALEVGHPDSSSLNEVCYQMAVENIMLDRALADCDASLRLRADSADTLDSRGFVLARLGRNVDALNAYDLALAKDPPEVNSLYGRGVVEARLGDTAGSQRDLAAATAAWPHIGEYYAKIGVR